MMRRKEPIPMPTVAELEASLKKEKQIKRKRTVFKGSLFTLITVAAVAVLVAMLFLPILEAQGNSMSPTLRNGEIIFSVKTSEFERGDIIAFYYDNNVLVKRVIGCPGDWIDIAEDGTVYVNDEELVEPYINEKAFGDCNIELPCQVPDGHIFVMGDHRATSLDSRNTDIGTIEKEKIVGKIIYRIWPLSEMSAIE